MNSTTPPLAIVALAAWMLCPATMHHAAATEAMDEEDVADAASVLEDMALDHEEDEEDNAGVSPQKKRRAPSRLHINGAARAAVRVKLSNSVALEVYGRATASRLQTPSAPGSSSLGGGMALSLQLGKFAMSTSLDLTNAYADAFGDYRSDSYTLRQGIARSFKLTDQVAITPAIGGSYIFSKNTTQNRVKFDVAAPIGWRVGSVEWQPLIPKIAYQSYSNLPRHDVTMSLGAGFRWDITKLTSFATSISFEQRESDSARARYSRWILAPQFGLKITL